MSSLRQKRPHLRLDPEAYRKLRMRVLQRDGYRCQHCGHGENLEIHHQQWRSHLGDDRGENLITLCAGCHAQIHGPSVASSG